MSLGTGGEVIWPHGVTAVLAAFSAAFIVAGLLLAIVLLVRQ